MLDFKEISLEDKPMIDSYYEKFGEGSCQHSFATSFCLQGKYQDRFCEKNDVLYIYRSGISTEEMRYYLFPMCDRDDKQKIKSAIDEVLDDAHHYGKKVRFFTITKKCKSLLEEATGDLFFIEDSRDLYEYIYDVEKIASMSGSLFQSKRNIINKLYKTYEGRITVKELTPNDIEEVKRVYSLWVEGHSSEDKTLFQTEMNEFNLLLKYFDKINVEGIGIYIDERLVGFNFGAIISNSTYDGMVQKGDYNYSGIYEMLNKEIANLLKSKIKYMNFEEDLGLRGLRKAKLMYHPDILLEKYIATEVGY